MTSLQFALIALFAGGVLPLTDAQSLAGADADAQPITVQIRVPADAHVLIDGTPTRTTGEVRRYVTPAVPVDRKYVYTLTVTAKGKIVTREITFRHGAENRFDLRDLFEAGQSADLSSARPQIINGAIGPRVESGTSSEVAAAPAARVRVSYYYAPAVSPPPPGAYSVLSRDYAVYNPRQFGSTGVTYDPSTGAYRVYNPVTGQWFGPFYR
jgi:uncharacterized protein (TIGR03000 family)